MINVAFNTTFLRGNLTGLGHYAYQLAKALQRKKRCKLKYFYGDEWSDELVIKDSGPVQKHKSFIRDNVPYSYNISRYLLQRRFNQGVESVDVYHEPNYLAFKTNRPTVVTVHDLSWILYPEMHPKFRVRAMDQFFSKSIEQATYIVTDSHYIKNEFVKYYNYPSDKVIPIHLGFEENFAELNDEEIENTLKKYELTKKKYILSVGTLEPRKNLSTAILAYAKLPSEVKKSYKLVIVGMKGWMYSDIELVLKRLIDNKEAIMLGYLPREHLRVLTACAKTLVFPSVYEGFGLPPLEAMACATPVIASNTSSIPEVVGDGGMLVHPQDVDGFKESMFKLIDDDHFYSELSKRALIRSQAFSWDKCADETFDVYQNLHNNY